MRLPVRKPKPGTTLTQDLLKRSLRIGNRNFFHFVVGTESLRISRQREGSPVFHIADVGQLVANYNEQVSFFIPDYNSWAMANASPIAEYLVYADKAEQKKRGTFLITGRASAVKVEDVQLYQKPPNLLQIDFRYESERPDSDIVIDRIIIGERDITPDATNTQKALDLAALCLDQMHADAKLTFNDNVRRIFRASQRRGLRPVMTGPRN